MVLIEFPSKRLGVEILKCYANLHEMHIKNLSSVSPNW